MSGLGVAVLDLTGWSNMDARSVPAFYIGYPFAGFRAEAFRVRAMQ